MQLSPSTASARLINPMKLLFVSPVGFIGGAERILLECVRQVRTLRPAWQVTVLMLAEGPLGDAVTKLGARIELVPLPSDLAAAGDSRFVAVNNPLATTNESSVAQSRSPWIRRFFVTKLSAVSFFWKLRQSIRRTGPDIIHSNGLKSHLCTSALFQRHGSLLWHIHDYYSHRPKIQRLIRLASRRATACFAISSSILDDIRLVAPKLQAHLLENCVDTDHFSPGECDSTRLDREAGFDQPSSMLRVGLVATYANWKGHDLFLQAIARLPNIRGYIVGGPLYTTAGSQWSESQLRKMCRDLGIQDRVGFIPFQSDPLWVYRSLDVVVHASMRPEPFGLTIVEAMACGRPVVVAAAGGAGSLFTDQWDALGHEPGKLDSLVAAIDRLANHSELRKQLGDHARQTAVERFSQARFGLELINLYEKLLPEGSDHKASV